MLRVLDPSAVRPYRVPWRVDRVYGTHPLVTNESDDAADFVRVFVYAGFEAATTEQWGQVLPGETVELCLCDVDVEATVVTLAWFRPLDGLEYVYRFVL